MSRRSNLASIGLTIIVGVSACGPALGRPVRLTSASVETAELEHELADIAPRLDTAADLVDVLERAKEIDAQRSAMGHLVAFFTAQLGEHARWVETNVYPRVDRYVGGSESFSASLRHEHLIMDRATSELTDLSTAEYPDVRRFVRISRDLLGLARAHVATEQAVLLPIVEREALSSATPR